jgi:hypothetical protein
MGFSFQSHFRLVCLLAGMHFSAQGAWAAACVCSEQAPNLARKAPSGQAPVKASQHKVHPVRAQRSMSSGNLHSDVLHKDMLAAAYPDALKKHAAWLDQTTLEHEGLLQSLPVGTWFMRPSSARIWNLPSENRYFFAIERVIEGAKIEKLRFVWVNEKIYRSVDDTMPVYAEKGEPFRKFIAAYEKVKPLSARIFLEDTCSVCLSERPSQILLPCGHSCLCADCASIYCETQKGCPLCRREIASSLPSDFLHPKPSLAQKVSP